MPKYKCQSCDILMTICGDGICPCGGDLVPYDEIKAPEIPLAYPTLFKPRLDHADWCTPDMQNNCDSGDCIQCEIAFNAGAGITPDK